MYFGYPSRNIQTGRRTIAPIHVYTRWSGTRVDNIPIQHDKRSRFGLIFKCEDLDHTLIPFRISSVSEGFHIWTSTDKYQERLPRYEATSKLPWDPSSTKHAGNEKEAQSKSTYNRVMTERDCQIVKLSTLCC